MLWRGMIPALLLGAAQDWRRIEPEETLYIDLERGRPLNPPLPISDAD